MPLLENYEKKFKSLRVDRKPNRYTTGKAPHKASLLLSIILLNRNGRMDLEHINTGLELREMWSSIWEQLEYDNPGSLHMPLFHMKSEGFWNIQFNTEPPAQVKSLAQFDSIVVNVSLEQDLIDLLGEENSRNSLINALLNGGYFSDQEIKKLNKFIASVDKSFEYEEKVVSAVREEFRFEIPSIADELAEPIRDASFRRGVLAGYDETCAVCGMRIVSSNGVSVIDAAHILPFHKFHNDNIRNGLALCKSHHWLFDHGLMSVDSHYRTIVSKTLEVEMPKDVISQYHKEPIILPERADIYPSHLALEWHRDNVLY